MEHLSLSKKYEPKQKSMKTQEQGQSNGSAEETIKQESNTELLEQIPIEDTPFTAVRLEDKWFLTMGKYRLTEPMETKAQIMEEAKDASWMRIMQICKIMIEEHESNKTKNN